MSREKLVNKGREVRRWRLHRRTNDTLDDLAAAINPIVRGWMNYWGHFYRSQMIPLLKRINTYLMRWARKKSSGYGRSNESRRGGTGSYSTTLDCSPTGDGRPITFRRDGRSRVTGDCHARICGSPGVRFPRATRRPPGKRENLPMVGSRCSTHRALRTP
jgi:Group II intron, maturase-specific domain